jgi:hypothetical protein
VIVGQGSALKLAGNVVCNFRSTIRSSFICCFCRTSCLMVLRFVSNIYFPKGARCDAAGAGERDGVGRRDDDLQQRRRRRWHRHARRRRRRQGLQLLTFLFFSFAFSHIRTISLSHLFLSLTPRLRVQLMSKGRTAINAGTTLDVAAGGEVTTEVIVIRTSHVCRRHDLTLDQSMISTSFLFQNFAFDPNNNDNRSTID